MKTILNIDYKIKDICEGFIYNEFEGKGLYGLAGKLVIQPEYQRNYIYADGKKDVAVIESILKGYPIGLLYFVKNGDKFEVLDGQQRITSIGRFVTNKFTIKDENAMEQYFDSLSQDKQNKILNTKLTVYECEGQETEIKEWFKTINIAGVPLNNQELLNAIYSGEFITKAKIEFSNSNNSNTQKWNKYIKGTANRQDYLATALNWVSHGDIDNYMATHRQDNNINELKLYFDSVIEWISNTFTTVKAEMKGLDWGNIYSKYHSKIYDLQQLNTTVEKLYNDEYVTDKKGIYEYVLGDCQDTKLLNVRIFDEKTKKKVYNRQTQEAKNNSKSNCPLCALSNNSVEINKIWRLEEMDADHVSAWSRGGETNENNCQMLCKTHNRAKGNR